MTRRLLLAALLATACGEKKTEQPPAAPAPSTATPAGEAKPARGEPERGQVGGGRMQHCPSAVPGAETRINDLPDGVEVTITSADAKAVADIRRDAKHLAEVAAKEPESVRHTGEGDGGGGLGKCQVVVRDTRITVAEIDGGVTITLKPTQAAELDALKKEVASRHAKARGP